MRRWTRRERYIEKAKNAQFIPVSIACINFGRDANIAYVVRAAACFGAYEVCLIGDMPKRSLMNAMSGSTYDYIPIRRFSTPEEFVAHCKENQIRMVSFELPTINFSSIPVSDFKFDFNQKTCIIVGNETHGVPVEILAASERTYIPMKSVGACLNTAHVANIALFKAAEQYYGW